MTQYTNTQIHTVLHDTNKYTIVDPINAVVGNTTNNIIVYAFTTEATLLGSLTNPRICPTRLFQWVLRDSNDRWVESAVIEYTGAQARPVSSAYPIYTLQHSQYSWSSWQSGTFDNSASPCYWQVFSTPCVYVPTGSQVYGISWNFPMQ